MMTDTVEMAPTDSRWIRVFSSPSDAPRVRWRTDLISAGFIAAMLVALVIVACGGRKLGRGVLTRGNGLPRRL